MPAELRHVALAAAALDDRLACRKRVLDALTEIVQFDEDRAFAELARRRFNDIHEQKERQS